MPTPRVVILAAGASRRLGQPKALVELPGGQPVVRLVRASLLAGCDAPVVVTGAHHDAIQASLALAFGDGDGATGPVLVCRNTTWQAGRTGSLLAAARLTGAADLCVAPVDHPRISADLLWALFAEWARADAPASGWLAPGLGTPPQPGHPVLLGRDLVAELLATPQVWSSRPLFELRKLAAPLWMLPTEDAAVLENLDRPEDLAVIRERDRET